MIKNKKMFTSFSDNPCQDGTHTCHPYAQCRPTGATSYTCQCLAGYEDHSPAEQPGRLCVPKQPICLNKAKMDCHAAAICQESSSEPEGFTCRCRDGYRDISAEVYKKPGRECEEEVRDQHNYANLFKIMLILF